MGLESLLKDAHSREKKYYSGSTECRRKKQKEDSTGKQQEDDKKRQRMISFLWRFLDGFRGSSWDQAMTLYHILSSNPVEPLTEAMHHTHMVGCRWHSRGHQSWLSSLFILDMAPEVSGSTCIVFLLSPPVFVLLGCPGRWFLSAPLRLGDGCGQKTPAEHWRTTGERSQVVLFCFLPLSMLSLWQWPCSYQQVLL